MNNTGENKIAAISPVYCTYVQYVDRFIQGNTNGS
jgi:hypothetical protein